MTIHRCFRWFSPFRGDGITQSFSILNYYADFDVVIHGSDYLLALIAAVKLVRKGKSVLLNPIIYHQGIIPYRLYHSSSNHLAEIKRTLKLKVSEKEVSESKMSENEVFNYDELSLCRELLNTLCQHYSHRAKILNGSYLLYYRFKSYQETQKLILSPCFKNYQKHHQSLPNFWQTITQRLEPISFNQCARSYHQNYFRDKNLEQSAAKSILKTKLNYLLHFSTQFVITEKNLWLNTPIINSVFKEGISIGESAFPIQKRSNQYHARFLDILAAQNVGQLLYDQAFYRQYLATNDIN